RSDFVVDRRVQTTVRVLQARLIQRAAAERRHVIHLNSLIRVVQSCAATDCVQPADCARVDGVDVVETVTRGELVALIDTVIYTREKVCGVEARRNYAGADEWPR